ncbi:tafazzin [Calliphora vicina]|uniref:tafazzin n=1 Tax=Calliphora vicina TaxID=7373 RepID=UPI00325A5AAA
MLSLCWRNNLKIHQFDVVSRQTMGQLLKYTTSRYHVQHQHHQQTLRKHTQVEAAVDDKTTTTTTSTTPQNSSKINNMKTSTSSVFSPYTKEESYQKMQLKHLQQQQQQPSHPSELPVAATTSKATATPATNPVHIPYNIDWVFERLKNPNGLWFICSQIAICAVGLFSKLVLVIMNKTKVYNRERLIEAVAKRPPGVPLVTVSNHHSCFDDPGLWGVLPVRYVCNSLKIRWSMAAHDICFTNKFHSTFFMFGKCIPVIRGCGVYQDAVDICVQKVKLGHWVHVFPEGKVNMTKEEMRLKWGVGRIIYESSKVPIIIPMWHEGMDDVLPNVEPYIIKWGKRVTVNIGKPIDMNDFINDLKSRGVPEPEARKLITDKIQEVFHNLRLETEELHKKHK